jgi:hypothetical protein
MDERPDRSDEITRDIRAHRGFTLAGALGGADGGGHLDGASPIAARQQFAYAVAQWLEGAADDTEGSLRQVLAREITGRDDLIGADPDHPQVAVAAWLREVLGHRARLRDLVREVDAEWGRRQAELPRFDEDGQPPAPDDPYPLDAVAARLAELLARAEQERPA